MSLSCKTCLAIVVLQTTEQPYSWIHASVYASINSPLHFPLRQLLPIMMAHLKSDSNQLAKRNDKNDSKLQSESCNWNQKQVHGLLSLVWSHFSDATPEFVKHKQHRGIMRKQTPEGTETQTSSYTVCRTPKASFTVFLCLYVQRRCTQLIVNVEKSEFYPILNET